MNKIYLFVLNSTLVLFLFYSSFLFSQNNVDKRYILGASNLQELKKLENEFIQNYRNNQIRIQKLAKEKGWDLIKVNSDGSFDELVGVLVDGNPLYYAIENLNASRSTRANHLNSGGSLNLNLNGESLTVGVWDGGATRLSHQEFDFRVTSGDGVTSLNGNSFHATHVTGTIAASGINPSAKGMAPSISVKTYDWSNDLTEVTQEIQNGLLLSNHSYGTPLSSINDPWYTGAYSQPARAWDQVAYAAPYYLMVASAGNDGNNTNSSPSTLGYDKLNGNKNAKNNLVVANAQDATVDNDGNLISVFINSGSSQGPSDDLRIKPDITGNGTGLFSTHSSDDTSYTSLSGTSMSGPNVMGTLALLQQYYKQLNGKYMRAATLKGLACHTADDAGNPGPDAKFGWGLLNAKAAAVTLNNNGLNSWIAEDILSQGQTYTMTVQSVVGMPLVASITWTDVPGVANNGVLNDPTPALVNDLDIRITQDGSTFFPWKLQQNANDVALRAGDNNVDNVEIIKIDQADGGVYTITVSHKGNLVSGKQHYSLIVTGISSSFAIIPQGNDKQVCATESAVFDFNFRIQSGNPVTFSASNQPLGSVVTFSSNSLSSNNSFTMTVSNLQNVIPGEYNIGVVGTNGSETETRHVKLIVYSAAFNPITQIYPSNGQSGIATTISLTWNPDLNATSYLVQISTNPSFTTIFQNQTVTENIAIISGLQSRMVYYWRIIPSNNCGTSSQVNFYSFQTGRITCDLTYIATDFTDAIIESVANSVATVPLIVANNFIIDNVTASIDINHTWVQDMTIYLEGPNNTVILLEEPCGGEDDIIATLNDDGLPLVCSINPAISGNVIPFQSMSAFNNLSSAGTWKLKVIDNYNQDGGVINAFSLTFCSVANIINNMIFTKNNVITNTNNTKVIVPSELNAQTNNQSTTAHVYTVIENTSLGSLKKDNTNLNIGDTFTQEDIIQNKISYTNSQNSQTSDSFVVNVINATWGWYSNEVVTILIQETLNISDNLLSEILIYPNPSKGVFTVKNPNLTGNNSELNLIDMQGRVVFSKTMTSSEEQINVNHLNNGVYILTISENDLKFTAKLILTN
ncbi:S8 family serine peptidase [Flavobacterium sp. UBA6135]|uniref:S8 family serine peptidase n=1 Tax=Flavobacterium sp. UBA6135 TaxID=1946553 RepID=UPI0025BC23D5|nr:S8 family serine peptidase [Flavobacterium sp. UBA6135]